MKLSARRDDPPLSLYPRTGRGTFCRACGQSVEIADWPAALIRRAGRKQSPDS